MRSYDALRRCNAIWDITSSVAANQIKERTSASEKINRTKVALDFAQSDIINVAQPALRFRNINGDDIYIYPGFVLVQHRTSDFALIELNDLSVKLEITRFIEEEQIPADSLTVGATWKKVNKDGSPDRRYADNYQIPIVRYGQLWLASSAGLHEAYMFSDAAKTENFAQAFANYRGQLANLARHSEPSPPQTDDAQEEIADEAPREGLDAASLVRRRFIVLDWLVAIALLGGICVAVVLGHEKFQTTDLKKIATSWFSVVERAPSPTPAQPPLSAQPRTPNSATPARPVAGSAAIPGLPATSQPNAAQANSEFVYVLRRSVNVRSSPSVDASVVRAATQSARFRVFRRDGEWAQVGDSAPIGWIRSDLLGSTPP